MGGGKCASSCVFEVYFKSIVSRDEDTCGRTSKILRDFFPRLSANHIESFHLGRGVLFPRDCGLRWLTKLIRIKVDSIFRACVSSL